jgi:putative ABC transport system permease protein
MLLRDLRAGELHLLGLALIIAVASLVSVGFLTDRVARSLDREATQLLGGDLLLRADKPWPEAMRAAAEAAGLRTADTLTFSSMVSARSGFQLVAVKAVSDAYPLRGEVRIAPVRNGLEALATHMPASGEIWPDERVMASLGVQVGDTVQLGNMSFRIGGVLTFESDRGVNFFSMLPRVMINTVDLPATGLIQTGSRVTGSIWPDNAHRWMPSAPASSRRWNVGSRSSRSTTRGRKCASPSIAPSASCGWRPRSRWCSRRSPSV